MEISVTVKVGDGDPIEVKVDIPEKGCETELKERIDVSPYTVWFDEGCYGWSDNPEMNKLFLIQQETYLNKKLQTNKHLFLNEVYDALGIPRTKAGQRVGWIYDKDHPIGDNYVNFGIYNEQNRAFVNGHYTDALLIFNVDGDILKYL